MAPSPTFAGALGYLRAPRGSALRTFLIETACLLVMTCGCFLDVAELVSSLFRRPNRPESELRRLGDAEVSPSRAWMEVIQAGLLPSEYLRALLVVMALAAVRGPEWEAAEPRREVRGEDEGEEEVEDWRGLERVAEEWRRSGGAELEGRRWGCHLGVAVDMVSDGDGGGGCGFVVEGQVDNL